jgi:hypothetical protein
MKVFRGVGVPGTEPWLSTLRARLQEPAPWPERRDLADRAAGVTEDRPLVFEYRADSAERATVWLFFDATGASVSNIVPAPGTADITTDEYNQIAAAFANDVLQPAATAVGLTMTLGPGEVSIQELLPPLAADALIRFSRSANKSTGSAHPIDGERWDEFVVAVHLARRPFGADRLRRWLVEDESWSDEMATALAIEYESARRLLATYDQLRGGA